MRSSVSLACFTVALLAVQIGAACQGKEVVNSVVPLSTIIHEYDSQREPDIFRYLQSHAQVSATDTVFLPTSAKTSALPAAASASSVTTSHLRQIKPQKKKSDSVKLADSKVIAAEKAKRQQLMNQLQQSQQALQTMQQQLAGQQSQLTLLKARSQWDPADLLAIKALWQQIKKEWPQLQGRPGDSEDKQRVSALQQQLVQRQQEIEQPLRGKITQLQQQLLNKQQQVEQLGLQLQQQKTTAEQNDQLVKLQQYNQQLQQQVKQQRQQIQQLESKSLQPPASIQTEKKVQTLLAKITALEAEKEKLQVGRQENHLEKLKTIRQQVIENKPSYAAGISLGKDILQLQKRNEALGEIVDRKILLQGITDAFNGQYQLDDGAIKQALRGANKRVENKQDKLLQDEKAKGQQYIAKFKQRAGVKTSAEGFYYLIEKQGNGAIVQNNPVTIMVKESLTDGTVVNDMFAQQAITRRRLQEYPPLFQQAIRLLGKGGEILLVAPPQLAYGDEGYPPKIPPGATMVYRLRVVS